VVAVGLPSAVLLYFNGPVSNCKSTVLALVFHPRIDEEGLDIEPWGFGVIVDAPAGRAVAAANALVCELLQETPVLRPGRSCIRR